jgi:hypothetical protein
MIDSNSQYFYNLKLSVIFLFVDFLGIKKASSIVNVLISVNSEGVYFMIRRRWFCTSLKALFHRSLFYAFLKSPQGLRRLVDFLGIKKASTIVKALILVKDTDIISNSFLRDLEVLCALKDDIN